MHMDTKSLLLKLDGSGSDAEWGAVMQLRKRDDFPDLLFDRYKDSKNWSTRASCVYHATMYAKESEKARQLGVLATQDKSKVVRYRAALLLAVAQNESAIGALVAMKEKSESSAMDAVAAIAAIQQRNPNLFVDRTGSGNMTLNIR